MELGRTVALSPLVKRSAIEPLTGSTSWSSRKSDVCDLRVRHALQQGVQSLHVGDELLDLVERAAGQPRQLVELAESGLLDDVGQAQDAEQLGPVEDVVEPVAGSIEAALRRELDVPRHRTVMPGQPAQRQVGSDEAAGPLPTAC